MSKPPINPDKTVAGIAVDPQTLERVIPESKRPDGSVRKQIKIRPGFTPQEDVRRFRGTKQVQMDNNALPKGHIIGWAPPPTAAAGASTGGKPLSKSAKKNAKRREKKEEKKGDAVVRDNWEDEDDEVVENVSANSGGKGGSAAGGTHTPDQPNWAAAPEPEPQPVVSTTKDSVTPSTADSLASKLEKLNVQQ